MSQLPSFPLYHDSIRERVFKPSKATCACCGKARGHQYEGPLYTEGDDVVLCAFCIADGSAATKFKCSFNDSLLQGNPKGPLTKEDADLVEHRTPGFESWQGNAWMACCGQACRFLGEAEASDIDGRWSSLKGKLRSEMAEIVGEEDFEDWLEGLEVGGLPAVYVFECRGCKKLQFFWDAD